MIRRVNTILDRYLAQRMGLISLFALVLFTVAWLAPEILFRAVRGIADKELTVAQGLLYLALQVPGVLAYCIPIAALFSSVFLFRQLSLSSELVAIQAAGISFKRLLLPIGMVGLALTGLFVLNQEVLQPQALKSLKHLSNTTGFQKQEQVPPFVTFVERSDNGQMSKFLIILPEAAPEQSQFICLFFNTVSKEMKTQIEGLENASQYITRIVTAQSSQWDASNSVWLLNQGWLYTLGNDGIYKTSQAFQKASVKTTPLAAKIIAFPYIKAPEMNVLELGHYVDLLARAGQTNDGRFFSVKWVQRFTLPWVVFIFSVLGCAIGIERSRSRKNLGLTYTALLLLLYNVMVSITTTMGNVGVLPVWLSGLLPMAFATASGLAVGQLRRLEL